MKKLALILCLPAVFFTGCETLQIKSTDKTQNAMVGGAVGCAGGALLAHLTGHSAAAGCVAGGVVGGLIGYERARQQELAEAEQARQDAIAALQEAQQAALTSSPSLAPSSSIKTTEVAVRDKATGEIKKVKTLDTVEVNIPLSMKDTPQYKAAMDKLRTLAVRMADQRGSAEINISMTATDAKRQKVAASSQSVKTDKGNTITVVKAINGSVEKGMERIVVKPGRLSTDV